MEKPESSAIDGIIEILLSKGITLPILLLVLYKLYVNAQPKPIVTHNKLVPEEESLNSGSKIIDMFGVDIPADKFDDLDAKEPIQYRPFKKGEYKLVMGINNLTAPEWLLVENTYKDITDKRKQLMDDKDTVDHIVLYDEDGKEATIEFYEMATTFMLNRYPQFFEIKGDQIHNKIRNEYIPLDPKTVKDVKQLNRYMNTFIEEDFIILLPGEEEYVFKSGCFTFPSGFDPLDKFNKPITSIHEPVPDYRTKLKSPMNKFFSKMRNYTYVRRNNWTIQVHNKLAVMGAESKGKEDEQMVAFDPEKLDFSKEVFFRTERQILTRLPRSGAICFTIRTYVYPMSQIREEIRRYDLCDAIEGMQWSVGQYKRKPQWGDAVVSFLKGETDGCEKPWIQGLDAK